MAFHTHGGCLSAHQESASLDLSFSFTLDNLRSLFVPPVPVPRPRHPAPAEGDEDPDEPLDEEETYEEPIDVYAEPRATGIVWPGLVVKVSRSSEGSSSRSRKARLVVNEADPNGYTSVLSSPGL